MEYNTSGGLQYVPQIAAVQQIIYLDFDGGNASYNGELLTVENVEVKDSRLTVERITGIIAALNRKYFSQNVLFVAAPPVSGKYSTIFVGKTSVFEKYGNFAGVAETIDYGNQNKTDKAFVMLDSDSSDDVIINAVSHETDHLLGTLDHGGSGLHAYAVDNCHYVFPGKTSDGVTVFSYDSMRVEGGIALNTKVHQAAKMYVSSGGYAEHTSIYYGGEMIISSGGSAEYTSVGGSLWLRPGASASEINIYNSGYAVISSGTSAANITVVPGGRLGGFSFDRQLTIKSAANDGTIRLAENVDLNTYDMHIRQNGFWSGCTVNSAGNMYIHHGGSLMSAGVKIFGEINVSGGGMVQGLTVYESGTVYVSSGGRLANTYVSRHGNLHLGSGIHSGTLYMEQGANVTLSDRATIDFSIGGRDPGGDYLINNLALLYGNPNFTITVLGSQLPGIYNLAQGAENFSGTVTIGDTFRRFGDITVNGNVFEYEESKYTLTGSGGNLRLEINAPAKVFIFSDGIITSSGSVISNAELTYDRNDSMVVYAGGKAVNTKVLNGAMMLLSGGSAENTILAARYNPAAMYVSSGGTATGTHVSSGAHMYVSSGGSAVGTVVSRFGEMIIFRGGTAEGSVLQHSGYMKISNGGLAFNTVASGQIIVNSGGAAYNTSVYSDAHVDFGGYACDTTVNSTYLIVRGVAENTVVNSGGYIYVQPYGSASGVTVSSGGGLYLLADGNVSNLTVKAGGFIGGVAFAEDKSISSARGSIDISANVRIFESKITVSSGGRVENTTLCGRPDFGSAVMVISSGGCHSGSMNIIQSASVTAYSGAVIDFSVCDMNVEDGYLINNLSLINGTPEYTITVSASQQYGTYLLAQGAENFSGTVSVFADGETHGSVTVNGNPLYYADNEYILTLNRGNLEFTINKYLPPVQVFSAGVMTSSGAEISGLLLSKGGNDSMIISSGGVAADTRMESYSSMYVYSGGSAANTMLYFTNTMYVSSGGSAAGTVISGGAVDVFNGGKVEYTNVNSAGHIYVSNGGFVSETTVNFSGYMHVFSNGAADNIVVNSGGSLIVSSGGTATNVHWTPVIGSVTSNPGAVVTYADTVSGVYFGSKNTLLSHTDTVTGKEVGYLYQMFVMNAGAAYDTVVNRGSMFIYSGGTADKLTLSAGNVVVYDGGKADGVNVSSGARLQISAGAAVNDIIISSGGSMNLYSGGEATAVTLKKGGGVGGFSFDADKNFNRMYGSAVVSQGVVVTDRRMYISSGAVALNVSMTGGNGIMYVSSGGAASGTVVSGGSCAVSVGNGGKIYDTVLFSSGNYSNSAVVLSGGEAVRTTVSHGNYLYVSSGALSDSAFAAGYMYVYSGGVACNTVISGGTAFFNGNSYDTVVSGGSMHVLSIAERTTVFSNGNVIVSSGAVASGTLVYYRGNVGVDSGRVVDTVVSSGGRLNIRGTAEKSVIGFGGSTVVYSAGSALNTTVNSGGSMVISSAGSASGITVNAGGRLTVSSGGKGLEIKENGGAVSFTSAGVSFVSNTISSAKVTAGNSMTIHSNTVAVDTEVDSGAYMYIYSGGVHGGSLHIESGAVVSAFAGAVIDFVLRDRTASDTYLINNLALVSGNAGYTVTVSANQAEGIYRLAQRAENFKGSVTVGDGTAVFGELSVNSSIKYNGVKYALHLEDGNLTFSTSAVDLSGNENFLNYKNVSDGTCIVQYSKDNFNTFLQLDTPTDTLDSYNLPSGTYRWRVSEDGSTWYYGDTIVVDDRYSGVKLISDNDGDKDIFFARSSEVWQEGYAAVHHGTINNWSGTKEHVLLDGKNRLADLFYGSTDANLLVMTDDANGDVLFLEDVYTALGNQARISQINEIRAGAGDDIIDLTGRNLAYSGSGITVYGGIGDDTVWANSGNNILFGDAGNDRLVGCSDSDYLIGGSGNDSMHGGGGTDTFCFGRNWGSDSVEQLADGKVILFFEYGSQNNWNSTTLTYSDGVNIVKVSGCSDVELKFGGDISALPAGAFLEAASENIFEDKNKGMLA